MNMIISRAFLFVLFMAPPIFLVRNSNSAVASIVFPSGGKSILETSQSGMRRGYILMPDTYMVEFSRNQKAKSFRQTICDSLESSHGIPRSAITMRQTVSSLLFNGASFTVNGKHTIDMIRSIPDVTAVYPVHFVPGPRPHTQYISTASRSDNETDPIIANELTGVDLVHSQLKNFGRGVRVAVIDTGVDYLHPALGGCFGSNCKVAFGYDFVGDEYSASNPVPTPDNDPMDNCTTGSHGTHVAGIVAANATTINRTGFSPVEPFVGVAPQAIIGAYRVFGCAGDSAATDIMAAAIYRAYDDKADIITMSIGGLGAFVETADSIAAQRVSEKGVYITFAFGNEGDMGLQTGGTPALSSGAIAVGSIENLRYLQLYLLTPDNKKIFYSPGTVYGGWRSIVKSKIVVNDATDDGCAGPAKNVTGAVVLYAYSRADTCGSSDRCNKAANAGAIGCLLFNVTNIPGGYTIPSGSISLEDALKIKSIVENNVSAIFTFTGSLAVAPLETGGTPSSFSSLGLTDDLRLKPEIAGIGGSVYSTISSFSAEKNGLSDAYMIMSGTSMATPYVAGVLALFLAQIGNPPPETVFNQSALNRRPSFSQVLNLIQSNAKPVNIYNSTLLASVAQQGAGLINAFQILRAMTTVSPSQIALNDTLRQAPSYIITVMNMGNTTVTYNISHVAAATATGLKPGNDLLLLKPIYTSEQAIVDIQPKTIQIEGRKSANITLQFQAPSGLNTALLPIFSGFIKITNNINEQVVNVPYAGVAGDYKNASILVRKNPGGLVTGILNSQNSYISSSLPDTLNSTKSTRVTLVMTWASRLAFLEVISGGDQTQNGSAQRIGFLYDELSDQPAIFGNPVRNTPESSLGYSQSYEIEWLGRVTEIISIGNISSFRAVPLSSGRYKVRFSAVKHFGDPDGDAPNFDVYETPVFNFIRVSTSTTSTTATTTSVSTTRTTKFSSVVPPFSAAVSISFSRHGLFISLYFIVMHCAKL